MEETKTLMEENFEPVLPKKPQKTKTGFKTKECRVIEYDKNAKTLDVYFDKYGIRIKDVENFVGETAILKYKGKIGTPNFEYKL